MPFMVLMWDLKKEMGGIVFKNTLALGLDFWPKSFRTGRGGR